VLCRPNSTWKSTQRFTSLTHSVSSDKAEKVHSRKTDTNNSALIKTSRSTNKKIATCYITKSERKERKRNQSIHPTQQTKQQE